MLSLHKGWLAFGVELDSYCERETIPEDASINNVGMGSLLSSKLYGDNNAAACSVAACTTQADCTTLGSACLGGAPAGTWTPAGNGPGKENLIGFATVTACTNVTAADAIIRDAVATTDVDCVLNVTSYRMGVFGHISGANYIGFEVGDNGVVGESAEVANTGFGDTCTT
ncbi:MAG: hypothetical protein OXK80_00700 [Bdellovibrionales bacterium]|nr:hypothetical protein [Bdellovibrionales bacterium]